jgi:hypothetical protein
MDFLKKKNIPESVRAAECVIPAAICITLVCESLSTRVGVGIFPL